MMLLMLMLMLRRARCVLRMHVGGCGVLLRGLVLLLVLLLVGGVDLVMQVVLPRRVGGLGGVVSHAVAEVSRSSLCLVSVQCFAVAVAVAVAVVHTWPGQMARQWLRGLAHVHRWA